MGGSAKSWLNILARHNVCTSKMAAALLIGTADADFEVVAAPAAGLINVEAFQPVAGAVVSEDVCGGQLFHRRLVGNPPCFDVQRVGADAGVALSHQIGQALAVTMPGGIVPVGPRAPGASWEAVHENHIKNKTSQGIKYQEQVRGSRR